MSLEPRPGDILGALGELGLISAGQVRVSGDEAYVLCPFHDDRSIGSFAINIGTGLCHCFACGNGGSFLKYLMAAHAMSRTGARRWCLSRLIATTAAPEREARQHEEISEASLALFTAPPPDALDSRAVSAHACRTLGVLWDAARRYWILPVRDPHTGQLLGWQEKDGSWMSVRPADIPVKSTLFGWDQVPYGGQVVLVESPLDTAVMLDAGYTAAACWGAAVSARQLELIADRCSCLVLALDDDKAGWKATDAILRQIRGIPVRVFNYGDHPAGKDPGELSAAAIQQGMATLLC